MIAMWTTARSVHFLCVEVARNSVDEHPTTGVPINGRSGKRGMMGGGVLVRWPVLLEGPRVVDSPSLGTAVVAGVFCPVTWQPPMPCLYSKKELLRKCTRAVVLLIHLGLLLQRPLGRLCFPPGPLLLTSAHVFSSAWSADHHVYKQASKPAHPAHILVELLPD